ncbi:MAG: TonB-dependent receptor [Bacteroidota bacterium]
MSNKLLSLLAGVLVFMAITSVSVFAQGVTTANLTGRVIGADNSPLRGATIIATHVPSGSRYGAIASDGGEFRLVNMRVGGPYLVVAKFIGYEEGKYENVSLTLGQTRRLVFQLSTTVTTLEEVEITSSTSDVFDGNKTGQGTVVSEEQIKALPTLTRSIADFARVNPLVNVSEATDGFSFSIAGQNNRYNSIYIDGSINNDQFGLAASGTDGGQTGAGPISLDAIEQLQVSVAPFDVRLSGFAGGAVNVITRSGTNNVEASAYYLVRNQDLAGETPSLENDDARTKLPDFTSETYGFRVGGPIIKDKLFFFINGEARADEIPEPFDFTAYNGAVTLADLDALRAKLNGFGYDPGTFTDNATTLDQMQFLAKIDWNVNDNHKVSIRHLYNDVENLEARSSSPSGIRFQNGSEFFPSTTNNTTFEVNSVFSEKISNQFRASMKFVRDDRDVDGQDFPWVFIDDAAGGIEFGGERFSTANRLDQDVFTITNDLNIFLGKHSLTIGTQNEFFKIGNLFIRENFGAYRYDSLAQFLNDIPAQRYDRSYSQVDNVAGDESAALAEYSGFNLGFYVQDEFQANDNLKLTLGLRLDIPGVTTDVPENEQFNTETISLLEDEFGAGILEGARTGQNIKTQLMFAPRFGFNWDVQGRSMTQVRGGIGVFNSRMPGVWFGGAYNNYGFNVAGTRRFDEVVFSPDVQRQVPGAIDPNNPVPGGQIDLFAEDFSLPQVSQSDHQEQGY